MIIIFYNSPDFRGLFLFACALLPFLYVGPCSHHFALAGLISRSQMKQGPSNHGRSRTRTHDLRVTISTDLISYRMHLMPHGSTEASLIASTIARFNFCLSSNTWSSCSFPSSLLVLVWASWVMAYSGSSTPYEALYGSSTLT